MAWRLARSLDTLRTEILALHPGTTVWTIGDAAHAATWSDHNPNSAGVVCAIDVKGNAGLKLSAFAEHVRTRNHRAFKYVIYNRRIARKGGAWQAYHGNNPHLDHVHISVGEGPDGRSTGPYDDTSPWGLLEEDDVSAEDVWRHRWEKVHIPGQETSAEGAVRWIHKHVSDMVGDLAQLRALVAGLAGQDPIEAFRAELAAHRETLLGELTEDLAERVAGRLSSVPAEEVRAAVREEGAALLARTRLAVGNDA